MALLITLSRTVGFEFPFASRRREFRLAATLSPTTTHAGGYTGHSQYSPKGESKMPIKDFAGLSQHWPFPTTAWPSRHQSA
jgi:hypothetical protein